MKEAITITAYACIIIMWGVVVSAGIILSWDCITRFKRWIRKTRNPRRATYISLRKTEKETEV